jgi:putative hydrolase of HD superfamily
MDDSATFPTPGTARSAPPVIDAPIAFALELDKLKAVTRKTRTLHADRYENSAEHSWQIALSALALAGFAEPGTDIGRVVQMLLVHDVGEIDTGDTLVYIEDGLEARKAAERVAVGRIFGLAPAEAAAGLHALWEEFEDGTTREARFAHAIDRAMPALINLANDGQSWRENGVAHARVVARIGPPIAEGCPALWAWMEPRLAAANASGWYVQADPAPADVTRADGAGADTAADNAPADTAAASLATPALTPRQRMIFGNYLRYRDVDPTVDAIFARGAKAYLLLTVGFAFIAGFSWFVIGRGFSMAVVGMYLGAILRDMAHFRNTVHVWPVLRPLLDWPAIARLVGGARYDAKVPTQEPGA